MIYSRRYQYLLSLLKSVNIEGYTAIDCGCGIGGGVWELLQNNYKVKAYDIDKTCILECAKIGVSAEVANLCHLPLPNNYADLFFCVETLEHLNETDIQTAVSEIKRTTRKNGIILITTPSDKKDCLSNPLHVQYLSYKQLNTLFKLPTIYIGQWFKHPNDKSSLVLILRNENGTK